MKNCNNCDHKCVCGLKFYLTSCEDWWSGWTSVDDELPAYDRRIIFRLKRPDISSIFTGYFDTDGTFNNDDFEAYYTTGFYDQYMVKDWRYVDET